MTKIIRNKNLPKEINVVINGKIVTKAVFNEDNIYETDNENVIKELKDYGYEVEETKKPKKKIEELD